MPICRTRIGDLERQFVAFDCREDFVMANMVLERFFLTKLRWNFDMEMNGELR